MKFVFENDSDDIFVSGDYAFEYVTPSGGVIKGRFERDMSDVELTTGSYYGHSDLVKLRDLIDSLIKVVNEN